MEDFEIIENKPQPQKEKTAQGFKIATIILAIVVVLIGGALWYVSSQKTEQIVVLSTEKDDLMRNLEDMRTQYDGMKTNNDTLNAQLEVEKQKVEVMIEKLRKTDASNKAQIRQYEKELGTLRDVMRGYVVQIDSLNTLNQQLRAQTAQARTEAQETSKKYETLVQKTDELQDKVVKGSVLKIRDINVVALNDNDKDMTRASRTTKIKTCFTLVENTLAERGFRRIYIRVKGPDGILVTHSNNNVFTVNGEQMIYSEMREIDYQGDDLEVCIFYGAKDEKFMKGVYTVEVFTDGNMSGSGQLLLK